MAERGAQSSPRPVLPPDTAESYTWHWLRLVDGGYQLACWRGDAWEINGEEIGESPEDAAEWLSYHGALLTPDGRNYTSVG